MISTLVINAKTNTGKAAQKSVPYLNPNLSNEDAKSLAQLIYGMSTDSFTDAEIVNKINVDETDTSALLLDDSGLNQGYSATKEIFSDGIRINFKLNDQSVGYVDLTRR